MSCETAAGITGIIGALIGVVGTHLNERRKERADLKHEGKLTLRAKVNEIRRISDECLHENERTLAGLPSDRRRVAKNMQRLFAEPHRLGLFAQWVQFLGTSLAKESDKSIKSRVRELLSGVLDLERAFYSDSDSAELIQDQDAHNTMKSFVLFVVSVEDTWPDEYVVEVKEKYLKFLRKTVERIGGTAGGLEGLLT